MTIEDLAGPAATAPNKARTLSIAVAGFGEIGRTVARHLSAGRVRGARLSAVAARDAVKARAGLAEIGAEVPVLGLPDLPAVADVVVECAPAAILDQVVRPVLSAGKKAVVLSVGALLQNDHLRDVARRHGGRILVPTGALLGLDAVSAAAQGEIHSVRMVTTKPVRGLLGAPHLAQNNIDISRITEPLLIFEGTAREAAIGFPANLNVAVALSLAGIGPDRTVIEIWASPSIARNRHRIIVESDSARLDMMIENIPSENPKTGRITALSVLALIAKMSSELRIGT